MLDTPPDIIHDIHAETRAKLDQEIERLTHQLQVLRSARNELAPISRLPAEIMREVFLLSRHSLPNPDGETSLKLSWVSRKWRDLALSIAHLWSSIDFIQPDWVRACQTRSRSVLLDVSVTIDPDTEYQEALSVVLAALPQITKLQINADDTQSRLLVLPVNLWENSRPQLTSLTFNNVSLPEIVLGLDFPSLTSIYLRQCKFRLSSSAVPLQLVKLCIQEPHFRISFSEILEILQLTPALEDLDLRQAVVDLNDLVPQQPFETPINLSYLRRLLIIQHEADLTLDILQHISFPPQIELCVDVISIPAVENFSVLEAVKTSSQLCRRSFKGLLLLIKPEAFGFYLDEDPKLFDGKTPVGMNFDGEVPLPSRITLLLEALLPAISGIEMLVLNGDSPRGQELFRSPFEMFGTFKSLRSLQLYQDFIPSFIEYITTTSSHTDEDASHNLDVGDTNHSFLAFPALVEMSFSKVWFSDSQLDSLRAWLQMRDERSFRLSKMTFLCCSVRDVTDLRGIDNFVGDIVFAEGQVYHRGG